MATSIALNEKDGRLEKAYLSIVPADKAVSGSKSGDTIKFKFNPRQFSVEKLAYWAENPTPAAANAGPRQWHGTRPKTMSLEVVFDESDTDSGNIVDIAEKLFDCCTPTDGGSKPVSAPIVFFGWGERVYFPATVTRVNVTFTMFRPDGTPYRGIAELSLREYEVETGKQNPTSGGLETRDAHQMRAGDTLLSVAYRAYGDPTLWRAIAHYNDIDDPMRVRPGTELFLPAVDELSGMHAQ